MLNVILCHLTSCSFSFVSNLVQYLTTAGYQWQLAQTLATAAASASASCHCHNLSLLSLKKTDLRSVKIVLAMVHLTFLQYILCVCGIGGCMCVGAVVFALSSPEQVPCHCHHSVHTVQGSVRLHCSTLRFLSSTPTVVRCGRQKMRLYPVMLVQPDGSTVNIRYKEPRRILMVSAPSPSLFTLLIIQFFNH